MYRSCCQKAWSLAALICLLPHTAVLAEDLLVPFSCSPGAAGVTARPSDMQRYRILGTRESDPFTACASDDQRRCRTIMLHRFTIDCNGRRVTWPEFYAAISEVTTGSANLDGDRLIVRIRPDRSQLSPRTRFETRPSSKPFYVQMPTGFAPVRGTVARFAGPQPADVRPKLSDNQPVPETVPIEAPQKTTTAPPRAKDIVASGATEAGNKSKRIAIHSVPEDKNTSQNDAKQPVTVTALAPGRASPEAGVSAEQDPDTSSDLPDTSEDAPPQIKILNAPSSSSEAKQAATKSKTAENRSTNAAKTSTDDTDEIAGILQKRAEDIADASTNSAPQNTNTPDIAASEAQTMPTSSQATSPTLFDTLSVFAVVASLLALATFALYRTFVRSTAKPFRDSDSIVTGTAPIKGSALSPAPSPALSSKNPFVSLQNKAPLTASNASDVKTELPSFYAKIAADKEATNEITSKQTAQPVDMPISQFGQLTAPLDRAPQSKSKTRKQDTTSSETQFEKREPSLSMGDKTSAGTAAATQLALTPVISDAQKPDASTAKAANQTPSLSPLALPTTRAEALTALGVAPNASDAVIERVVTTLRDNITASNGQSDAERTQQHQRLKQIEEAWQILSDPPGKTN